MRFRTSWLVSCSILTLAATANGESYDFQDTVNSFHFEGSRPLGPGIYPTTGLWTGYIWNGTYNNNGVSLTLSGFNDVIVPDFVTSAPDPLAGTPAFLLSQAITTNTSGTFELTNIPAAPAGDTYSLYLYGTNAAANAGTLFGLTTAAASPENGMIATVNSPSLGVPNDSFAEGVNYVLYNNVVPVNGTISGTVSPNAPSAEGDLNGLQLVLTPPTIPVTLPSVWNNSGGGAWTDAANWQNGVPNGLGAEADFYSAITASSLVTLDSAITLGTLHFDNPNVIELGQSPLSANGGSLTMRAGPIVDPPTSSSTGYFPALIEVDQSTDRIDVPLTFAASTLLDVATGATLVIGGRVTINPGVRVRREGGGKIVLSSLTLGLDSAFDLNNGSLWLNYGAAADPAATIESYLMSGYNSAAGSAGAWQGNGLTSSMAAANPGTTSIGYADGDNPIDAANTGVGPGQMEVMCTAAGDVNLSGSVDLSDLVIVASDFGMTGADWAEGDVNYDGSVDLSDLVILASNFGASLSSISTSDFSGSFAAEWQLALAEVRGADVSVPEPCFMGLAVAAILLTRRQRSKQD
jgi:hypothetical protein